MKRQGYIIERVCTTENLLQAFHNAQKGKSGRAEVELYRNNLFENIEILRIQLKQGNVPVGNYHSFEIYDPKRRTICAASFNERVLHHALMNICQDRFEKSWIEDSYSARKGKGTYAALHKARFYFLRHKYVAKLDVRKYFDSIDHPVLVNQLERLFKDRRLLKVFGSIIDSYNILPGKGIPIGNLTSQYFANHYLNTADHYIKEILQVKGYVRYMDDMLLFSDNRDVLVEKVHKLQNFLTDKLKIELKPPIINETTTATSFLGYRIKQHQVLLTSRSRRRFEKKYKSYQKDFCLSNIGEEELKKRMTSLVVFTQYAYSKKCRQRIIKKVESQWDPTASTEVAAGTTASRTARYPTATTTRPPTATTTSASASSSSLTGMNPDGFTHIEPTFVPNEYIQKEQTCICQQSMELVGPYTNGIENPVFF